MTAPERTDGGLVLGYEADGSTEKIEVDQVLVAIGRKPVIDDIGLEAAGVTVGDRGFVEMDTATMATTVPASMRSAT